MLSSICACLGLWELTTNPTFKLTSMRALRWVRWARVSSSSRARPRLLSHNFEAYKSLHRESFIPTTLAHQHVGPTE